MFLQYSVTGCGTRRPRCGVGGDRPRPLDTVRSPRAAHCAVCHSRPGSTGGAPTARRPAPGAASAEHPVGVACARPVRRAVRGAARVSLARTRRVCRVSRVSHRPLARVGLTRQLRPATDAAIAHGSALFFIRILVTNVSELVDRVVL